MNLLTYIIKVNKDEIGEHASSLYKLIHMARCLNIISSLTMFLYTRSTLSWFSTFSYRKLLHYRFNTALLALMLLYQIMDVELVIISVVITVIYIVRIGNILFSCF